MGLKSEIFNLKSSVRPAHNFNHSLSLSQYLYSRFNGTPQPWSKIWSAGSAVGHTPLPVEFQKMRVLVLIALLALCLSCKNDPPPPDTKPLGRYINKISFKEKEILGIKQNFRVVDSIFRIMNTRKNIPIKKTGYAAYDTVFYYETCLKKGRYSDIGECRLDTILTQQEIEKCNRAILNLVRLGFHSCEYDTLLGEYQLLLDAGFEDDRDYRSVLVKDKIDRQLMDTSKLRPVDSKDGLTLLKIGG